MMIKSALLILVKLPPLVKLVAVLAVATPAVAAASLPVHDIWFDYALFVVCSSIVTGMPEPDTELPLSRFLYSWFYRSSHLMVASATAYFMHQNKWGEIGGGGLAPNGQVKTTAVVAVSTAGN